MPGDVLDRADRVEGDGGRGDDGPAGLDEQPGVEAAVGHAVQDRSAPLGDRGRLLAGHVGHAEPAAEDQLGEVEGAGHVGHDRGGLGEGLHREHVGTDVGVEADELDRGGPLGPLDRRRGGTAGQAEAELRVVLAGLDVLVGVGVDAGRDAQQHPRRGEPLGVQGVEAVELVEGVDDDAPDAGAHGGAELVEALVVAVEDEVARRARRRPARRGARRPWRRRAAGPPRGPAGPWPRRGRPCWRRPRCRRRTRRRPRGPVPAGGPRRRRTAGCRARRPDRAANSRRWPARRSCRGRPSRAAGSAGGGRPPVDGTGAPRPTAGGHRLRSPSPPS